MSADKPARKNNKTSTPKSIFDTPKTRPKKKKLYADRDICNANIDIDAERTTRSMVRALNNSDSNLPGLFNQMWIFLYGVNQVDSIHQMLILLLTSFHR